MSTLVVWRTQSQLPILNYQIWFAPLIILSLSFSLLEDLGIVYCTQCVVLDSVWTCPHHIFYYSLAVNGRGIPVSIIFQIGTGGVVDGARPFDFPFSPADADEPLEQSSCFLKSFLGFQLPVRGVGVRVMSLMSRSRVLSSGSGFCLSLCRMSSWVMHYVHVCITLRLPSRDPGSRCRQYT